jgi:hypothetical protein
MAQPASVSKGCESGSWPTVCANSRCHQTLDAACGKVRKKMSASCSAGIQRTVRQWWRSQYMRPK